MEAQAVQEVQVYAEHLAFPEAPVCMEDGSLIVAEVAAGRLTRLWGEGKREVVAIPGGGPNGAAIGRDGALYVCNSGGVTFRDLGGIRIPEGRAPGYSGGWIDRIDLFTGAVDRLYDCCGDVPLKGPNDLVFDGEGGFWFTDYGHMYDRVADLGAIYYARPDGSQISEARFPLMNPNGIGISPDGKTIVVAETFTSRIWALAITGAGTLAPASPALPGRLIHGEPRYRLFDSLAVMADGRIAVGTLVEGGITVVGGDKPEFHPLPDPLITNLAFGGAEMRTAYATGSASGKVFKLRFDAPGLKLAF